MARFLSRIALRKRQIAGYVAIWLWACASQALGAQRPASISAAYSLDDVVSLVRGNVSTDRILTLVRQDCVSFALDSAAETRLKAARADSVLVAELRSVCVRRPSATGAIDSVRPAVSPKTSTMRAKLQVETTLEAESTGDTKVSPDGKWFLTIDSSLNTVIWDATTKQSLLRLRTTDSSRARGGSHSAFSPNSRLVATLGSVIRVWAIPSGELIRSIDHGTGDLQSVAFSPDGNLLATGGQEGSARIWNVATGTLVRTIRHYEPPKELPRSDVSSVAFSPDGNILATVGWDGNARLWNVASGSLLRVMPVGVIGYCGAFSADGRLFATSGDTNNANTTAPKRDSRPSKIRLWEVETGRLVRTLEGHADAVHFVSFSPDGTLLVSSGDDDTVRLWAAADGDLLDTVLMPATSGLKYGNVGVAFFPDGKSVLTASGAVKVWSIVH